MPVARALAQQHGEQRVKHPLAERKVYGLSTARLLLPLLLQLPRATATRRHRARRGARARLVTPPPQLLLELREHLERRDARAVVGVGVVQA